MKIWSILLYLIIAILVVLIIGLLLAGSNSDSNDATDGRETDQNTQNTAPDPQKQFKQGSGQGNEDEQEASNLDTDYKINLVSKKYTQNLNSLRLGITVSGGSDAVYCTFKIQMADQQGQAENKTSNIVHSQATSGCNATLNTKSLQNNSDWLITITVLDKERKLLLHSAQH